MGGETIYNLTMKKILRPFIILAAFLIASLPGNAQEKTVKQIPPKPTAAIDGKSLFHEYCAVCHGPNGTGGGPAAGALKVAPSDLTQISRHHEGKFPEERIMRVLQGDDAVAAHGNRAMPIWGKVFNDMGSLTMGQMRVHALLQYLEGLQAK
jgi:mono/diheme cytochrome c family protein